MRRFYTIIEIVLLLLIAASISADAAQVINDCNKLFNLGRYKEAAECFSRAADAKPNDPALKMIAGVAHANIKNYGAAAKYFGEASKLAPYNPLPYFLLEGVYTAQGRQNEAVQAHAKGEAALRSSAAGNQLNQVWNINASNVQTRSQLLEPVRSAAALEKVVEANPDNAIAHNLLGDLYQLEGRFNEASAHYRSAVELAPNWPKPWFNLGMAELGVDPAAAIKSFLRVIQLDPNNTQAYMWLGDAYSAIGDLTNAMKAYNKAASDASIEAQARIRLGNIYQKQDKLEEAEKQFNKASAISPHDPTAAAGLAEVYQRQGMNSKSETEYKRAMKSANSTQQAVIVPRMSQVQIANGDYEKAIAELKNTIAKTPAYMEPIAMLVQAYMHANKLSQGIVEYEAALNRNPRDTVAMRFLLEAYKISGDREKRVSMAKRLVGVMPEQAADWYKEMGLALLELSKKDEALGAWQKGLDLQPGFDPACILKAVRSAGLIGELAAKYEERLQGGSADVYLTLSGIYEFDGDFANAVRVVKKLTEKYPNDQRYWILLGDEMIRAGDIGGAKQAYTKAARLPGSLTLQSLAVQKLKDLH
jgi:tetratricopeptide (TPR) repeat protein